MATVDTLQSLFVAELRDLLDAEKQLVRTLPKLAKMATAEALAAAFREHLAQTREHVARRRRRAPAPRRERGRQS